MNYIWHVIGLVIASILSPAKGVELIEGQRYTGGTELTSSELGVTLTLPHGWQGGVPVGSDVIMLDANSGLASMLLVFDSFSQAQIESFMADTIPLDNGLYLQPSALPSRRDNVVMNHFQVVGSAEPLSAHVSATALREGLSLTAIVLAAHVPEQLSVLTYNTLNSVTVFEPVKSDVNESADAWQLYMQGRYIARFYTGSGYREKQQMWLCSDGSFATSFNAGGYSMDGFSSTVNNANTGTWQASGSIDQPGELTLVYNNGKQIAYQLMLQESLYLDGQKWLRGENARCY